MDIVIFNSLAHGKQIISLGKFKKKYLIQIVRYEDLLNQTYATFKEVIEFINEVTKNTEKINKDKIKNSVNSTLFDKLKNYEKQHGFSEAVESKKENKKISFFNLGPKNDWKKILDKKYTRSIFLIKIF